MTICFGNLFKKYVANTPSYNYIIGRYFLNHYFKIDHWAHRSLDNRNIINDYECMNYKVMPDIYNFPRFNVKANWLRNQHYRVFVSQYMGTDIPQIKSLKDYEDVFNKNQYLAWTLIFGDDINHIALMVNNIEKINSILKSDPNIGKVNDIQVSKDGNLLQFGLAADLKTHVFPDGSSARIPAYFVEFVERKNDRDGFEEDNADVIFDSTKKH